MATFNLDDIDRTTDNAASTPVSEPASAPAADDQPIKGLNSQESADPNAIQIVLQNRDIPIVVFFGPPTCGKTMTLIRLSRYLLQNGYSVAPVRSFRPGYDEHYKNMCDNFNVMINSNLAQEGNSFISFMLVEVSYKGRPLCQILEAPGEHYFKPSKPNAPFPAYINVISSSPNRKLWGFFIEPDHTNSQLENTDRLNYVDRIGRFKSYMHPRDRVAIIFNKIDQTDKVINVGMVNTSQAYQLADYTYPGLFKNFANENPITKFFKSTRAAFVPYMNGYFTELMNGGKSFQIGHDNYPRNLWGVITKSIKG